jgi:hypothetical protein
MAQLNKTLLAAGLLVLFGLGGYWLARLAPELFPDTRSLEPDPACDLRSGGCTRVLPDGGSLVFRILPPELPLMQPLQLLVELEGREVAGVQVDISGLNMDMGINRTRLEPAGNGRWTGSTLLPICSQQVMLWEAAVWLEDDSGIVSVPHRFETRR